MPNHPSSPLAPPSLTWQKSSTRVGLSPGLLDTSALSRGEEAGDLEREGGGVRMGRPKSGVERGVMDSCFPLSSLRSGVYVRPGGERVVLGSSPPLPKSGEGGVMGIRFPSLL